MCLRVMKPASWETCPLKIPMRIGVSWMQGFRIEHVSSSGDAAKKIGFHATISAPHMHVKALEELEVPGLLCGTQ